MLLFLKNLAFTIIVPGTVAFYIPIRIAGGRSAVLDAMPGWERFAGLVTILLGLAVYLWCVWDFATIGRGTPLPIDEPRKLVVRGPYRYVRNPMYIGVLLVIIGWAIFFRSLQVVSYSFCVCLAFHLFVIIAVQPW